MLDLKHSVYSLDMVDKADDLDENAKKKDDLKSTAHIVTEKGEEN